MQSFVSNNCVALHQRLGIFLFALLYAAALAFALVLLVRLGGVERDTGWDWRTSGGGNTVVTRVDPNGPAAAILAPGDLILSVSGDVRARSAGPRAWLQTVNPDETYRISWHPAAGGPAREATLTMGERVRPVHVVMAACDIAISIAFAIAGLFLWWSRPNDRLVRICYIAAMLMAFFMLGSATGPASPLLRGFPLLYYIVAKSAFPFHLAAGCTFFMLFPEGKQPDRRWRAALKAVWVGAVVVWAITAGLRVIPYLWLEQRLPLLTGADLHTRPELGLLPLRHGYAGLCALFIISVCLWNYTHLTNALMRLRVRWVVFGAALAVTPSLLYSAALAVGQAAGLVQPAQLTELTIHYSAATLFLIMIPVTVTLAVLSNRIMGVRVAVLTSMQALAARRVLGIVTLMPAVFATIAVWQRRHVPISDWWRTEPFFCAAIAAAALVTAFRRELLQAVERFLSRLPYDRDLALRGLMDAVLKEQTEEAVAAVAATRIDKVLRPGRVLIYGLTHADNQFVPMAVRGDRGSQEPFARDDAALQYAYGRGLLCADAGTVPDNLKTWLQQRKIEVVIPVITESAVLRGALLIGEKSSGESWSVNDLDLLTEVARQIALAWQLRDLQWERDNAIQNFRRAEQSDRERVQLLAQTSHEIRAPLHGVVGLTDLLLDTPLNDQQQEYAELIRRSSKSMVVLANDLLELSRSAAGQISLVPTEFDWWTLLDDVLAIAAQRVQQPGVELALQFDPSMPATHVGDSERIRQILLNLLDNAVKNTSEGWVVLRARLAREDRSVLLEVQDTGPGIPADLRERLFQPYQRGATQTEGAGLGLAISRMLVETMNGTITEEGKPGQGALFQVRLPIVTDTFNTRPEPLKGLTVICVDEEPVSLEALGLALLCGGATVHTVSIDPGSIDWSAGAPACDAIVWSTRRDAADVRSILMLMTRYQPAVPVVLVRGDRPVAHRRVTELRRPVRGTALLQAIKTAVRPEQASPAADQAETPLENSCQGLTVLLVEDDPATARLTDMTLQHLGCRTMIAGSGAEALQLLRSRSFDIAFLDCQLPGMDGAELASRIRALDGPVAQMPLVALSGHMDSHTMRRLLAAGVQDCLLKPASGAEIRDTIWQHHGRTVPGPGAIPEDGASHSFA